MKWMTATALFACLCMPAPLFAATPDLGVYPVPQEVKADGATFAKPAAVRIVQGPGCSENALRELGKLFRNDASAAFTVKMTCQKDAAQTAHPEGWYSLNITANGIDITASSSAGLFYAVQTLRQLCQNNTLPVCAITDYPDVPFRGTVEGFYGKPWSFEARKRQLEFYGQWKMNTYIYGPKDDPFHGFGNKWRDPYPAEQAAQMAELVKTAHENEVNFVWAVHPGNNIRWDTDADLQACIKKFNMMYDLGVRSFAVFFDDIGGIGAQASNQAKFLNAINEKFIKTHPDVTALTMCPTQYSQGGGASNYLKTLAAELSPEINIMWTGPGICSDITRQSVVWANENLKRKPFIWWNWPVSDYCRTRLLLGRTYGPSKENIGGYAGFVSNPMEHPEASKIALFGIADYTWNLEAFDSEKSWKNSFARLYNAQRVGDDHYSTAEAMHIFAANNSDQGNNGHGYRRFESEELRPVLDRVREAYKKNGSISAADARTLRQAFKSFDEAADVLEDRLAFDEPILYDEIYPWIHAFDAVADAGEETIDMLESHSPEKKCDALSDIFESLNEAEMEGQRQYERRSADRYAQKAVACGSHVLPFINAMIAIEGEKLFGKPAAKEAEFKVLTNNKECANFQVRREEKKYVRIKPGYEVIRLAPGDFLGIELPSDIFGTYIHLEVDNPAFAKSGAVHVSQDGKTFEQLRLRGDGKELQTGLDVARRIRFFKYVNTSKETLEFKVKQFKFDVPADAFHNAVEAMTDRDVQTFYTVDGTPAFEVPCACSGTLSIIADGLDHFNVSAVYPDGTTRLLKFEDNAANVGNKKTRALRFERKENTGMPERFYEIYHR